LWQLVAAHKLLEKTDAAPQPLYYGKIDISDSDPTYGHLSSMKLGLRG
jgi:hypothetical protein